MLQYRYIWDTFRVHLALFFEQQAELMKAISKQLTTNVTTHVTPHHINMTQIDWMHRILPPRLSSLGLLLLTFLCLLREWIWISTCIGMGMRSLQFIYDAMLTDRIHIIRSINQHVFSMLKYLPPVQRRLQRELQTALTELRSHVLSSPPSTGSSSVFSTLPTKGLSSEETMAVMATRHGAHLDDRWKSGRVSGTVYVGDNALPHLHPLLVHVMDRYLWSNPLHPDVFPDVRHMEAEVIRMCIHMYGGDPRHCCGSITSGGTESILLACKAHRDYLGKRHAIATPEIVAPATVHAAFQKAAEYLGMRFVEIPVDAATGKVSVARMARAISGNTVLLVASAPGFPHGIIDPVRDIARLAQRHRIGCHVDACLGGFLLPFVREAGFADLNETVDLRLPGITSLSCDTHKYGFAPKGSSVVLYTQHDLHRSQYSVMVNWPGGIYASPTLAGSRSGATIAGCWAALVSIGRLGYIDTTRRILTTARNIRDRIAATHGLHVVGTPLLSVIAFGSHYFDIYRLGTAMLERGNWHLNFHQFPTCLQICITLLHEASWELFIGDLEACVATLMATPTQKAKGVAAIYGMGAVLPDRTIVDTLTRSYLDVLYEVGDSRDESKG